MSKVLNQGLIPGAGGFGWDGIPPSAVFLDSHPMTYARYFVFLGLTPGA